MDKLVIRDYLDDPGALLQEALNLQSYNPPVYDRYYNPFEKKWCLNKQAYEKHSVSHDLLDTMRFTMIASDTCWWVSRLLEVPIDHGDVSHYGGVFIYEQGDYLKPHCDAGIHPTKGQRKVATACLYLTPATLYFYKGDTVWMDKPVIRHLDHVFTVEANSLVLFTNHDTAWHEVPLNTGSQQRVVITVSYLAPLGWEHPKFMNKRTRAYFARHMSLPDSPELAELRERRASEQHHEEVYRV